MTANQRKKIIESEKSVTVVDDFSNAALLSVKTAEEKVKTAQKAAYTTNKKIISISERWKNHNLLYSKESDKNAPVEYNEDRDGKRENPMTLDSFAVVAQEVCKCILSIASLCEHSSLAASAADIAALSAAENITDEQVLNRVSKAALLAMRSGKLQPLLKSVAGECFSRAQLLAGQQRVFVFLRENGHSNTVRCVAAIGEGENGVRAKKMIGKEMHRGTGVSWRAMDSMKPLYIPNVLKEPGIHFFTLNGDINEDGTEKEMKNDELPKGSYTCMPLICKMPWTKVNNSGGFTKEESFSCSDTQEYFRRVCMGYIGILNPPDDVEDSNDSNCNKGLIIQKQIMAGDAHNLLDREAQEKEMYSTSQNSNQQDHERDFSSSYDKEKQQQQTKSSVSGALVDSLTAAKTMSFLQAVAEHAGQAIGTVHSLQVTLNMVQQMQELLQRQTGVRSSFVGLLNSLRRDADGNVIYDDDDGIGDEVDLGEGEIFSKLDLDGSGTMNAKEMLESSKKIGLTLSKGKAQPPLTFLQNFMIQFIVKLNRKVID